ncbi:MAG: efflux RND transporter periplasmic adaptor subunit [Clostridia bacterium]|nr:efflux RND transporter periplasmic adaptor subunit [Clostridia bacterium]
MKKKRKLLTFIIVIVIIAAVGVGGYFAYQKWLAPAGSENTVYVQSVSDITGIGSAGLANRYSGIIEAKEEVAVNPDGDLEVKERYVEAGDTVLEGDPLFCYDVDSLTLSYEQLLLDIVGLDNTIIASNEEIASLQKRIERARESDKYELTLELQTAELTVKKSEYERSEKQKQADEMKKAIDNSIVYSPVSGMISSVRSDDSSNDYYGYGSQQSNDYIKIVAGSDYCVKGTVSEQTVYSLYEGMEVLVRSRIDQNQTFTGRIYKVNTEKPESSTNDMYYYGGDTEGSSKYAFYVELDSIEGLLMGQHVIIEPLTETPEAVLALPEYYFIIEGEDYFVYAADSSSRIEKRKVTVGEYFPDTASYEILDGLELKDRIAFPDETVSEGMGITETQYAPDSSEDDFMNDTNEFLPEDVIIGG